MSNALLRPQSMQIGKMIFSKNPCDTPAKTEVESMRIIFSSFCTNKRRFSAANADDYPTRKHGITVKYCEPRSPGTSVSVHRDPRVADAQTASDSPVTGLQGESAPGKQWVINAMTRCILLQIVLSSKQKPKFASVLHDHTTHSCAFQSWYHEVDLQGGFYAEHTLTDDDRAAQDDKCQPLPCTEVDKQQAYRPPVCSSSNCRAKCPFRQRSKKHGHYTCYNCRHEYPHIIGLQELCTQANYGKHEQCGVKVPIANGHAEAYSRFQGLLYLKPQSFQYQQQQKPALQDCRVAKQVSAKKTFCSNFGFIVKLTDAYREMFSRPAYRRAGNPEVAPPGRRPGETLAHQIRRVAGIDEGQGRDRTPPRPTQSPTLHGPDRAHACQNCFPGQ